MVAKLKSKSNARIEKQCFQVILSANSFGGFDLQ